MTISTHHYQAHLQGPMEALDLRPDAEVVLDESWAPYVQARLVLGMPTEAVLDALDPRLSPRVLVSADVTYHPSNPAPAQSRTFDLGVRDRDIDHEAGTVSLVLAGDEALLQEDILRADTANLDAYAHQASLRAIIDQVVLSRIGAALEPGPADAPFYVLTSADNDIANPGVEVDLTAVTNGGNCTFIRDTTAGVAYRGAAALRITNSGLGLFAVIMDTSATVGTHQVTAGEPFTFRYIARANSVLDVYAAVRFFNSSNGQVGADVSGVRVATSTTTWKLVEVSGTVPEGAVKVMPMVFGDAWTGEHRVWVDDVSLSTVPEYFDGDTPDTLDYGYNWTGTPGKSTSTRLALVDRSPEMLRWTPGKSAWEFIQPLFQAAGMRLFCDESRRWHLVEGAEHVATGHLQLAYGQHLTKAQDRITRDGDQDYADAAVVRYTWTDPDGTSREQFDHYAEPGATRTRTVEVAAPYPGPGFARYLVRRSLGRGRTLELAAVSQLHATPGQPVTVTVPFAPIQVGAVSRVRFDLGTGGMDVGTRGLTDTTPDAWAFGPADTDWDDLDPAMDWANFEWS